MATPEDSRDATDVPGTSATTTIAQSGARPQSPKGRAAVPISSLQRSDSTSIELTQQYETLCDGEIPDELNYMVTMCDPKTNSKMAFQFTELASPDRKLKPSRYPAQSDELE